MSTRKPPYQHEDGTGCWTKGCSLRSKTKDAPLSYEKFYENLSPTLTTTQSTPEQTVEMLKTKYGATVRFNKTGTGYAVIDYIIIPKEKRNQGVGTKVMEDIIKTADSNKWDLALTPSDVFGSSEKRLEAFYRRFGFVRNNDRSRKPFAQEKMIRYAN